MDDIASISLKNGSAAARIRALAEEHKISYTATPTDLLGHQMTRLSGDDVDPDSTELLLLALRRAGIITGKDAVLLHAAYLNEAKQ